MPSKALAAEVRRRIREQADRARAERERRYFKETIRNRGLSVPACRAIAREIFGRERAALAADDWLLLAERLLAGGWHEEATIGLVLAGRARPAPSARLFATYEGWLGRYVGNWAHCDELGTHLIGPLLIELPTLVRRLRPWTASRNRWLRRGAAVSLVLPARRGRFLKESLAIAGALLTDEDDLVQKGYGWLLKEAARVHRPEVTAFLERHTRRMPRTAFRYAIEKFPAAERKRLMAR